MTVTNTSSLPIQCCQSNADAQPGDVKANGIAHGFAAEFNSAENRDYYVKTGPTHQAFVDSISSLVEKAAVVDFTNCAYEIDPILPQECG
ncbi:hypothetical protein ACJZ2D_013225 [Fusarium nematophilum]